MWARVVADFCFVLSIGWGVWWLFWIVRDAPDVLTRQGPGELLNQIWLVVFGVVSINVGAVWVMLKSTPSGGPRYYPWRRWLGWIWKRRAPSFAAEWAEVGPYLGTDPAAYLRSHQWQQRRLLKVRQAGHRCQVCRSEKHLQVHHLTLDHLFNERPDDLIALCGSCHRRATHLNRGGPLAPRGVRSTSSHNV